MADEQKAIKKARENKSKRRPAVKLALKQKCKNKVTSDSLHSDQQGWQDRLCNAFGTRSTDFVDAELQRVLTMFRGKDGKIDITAVEAVLAVLDGSEPANEVEAMLLIQMATTHALAMKIARRLVTVDTIQQNNSARKTATDLHHSGRDAGEPAAWRPAENDRRACSCSSRRTSDRRLVRSSRWKSGPSKE